MELKATKRQLQVTEDTCESLFKEVEILKEQLEEATRGDRCKPANLSPDPDSLKQLRSRVAASRQHPGVLSPFSTERKELQSRALLEQQCPGLSQGQ